MTLAPLISWETKLIFYFLRWEIVRPVLREQPAVLLWQILYKWRVVGDKQLWVSFRRGKRKQHSPISKGDIPNSHPIRCVFQFYLHINYLFYATTLQGSSFSVFGGCWLLGEEWLILMLVCHFHKRKYFCEPNSHAPHNITTQDLFFLSRQYYLSTTIHNMTSTSNRTVADCSGRTHAFVIIHFNTTIIILYLPTPLFIIEFRLIRLC